MKITTPRRLAARYSMSPEDERLASELARSAGEQLDANHWMLTGGTRSLAGQLGRILERRIFASEYGGHSPDVMAAEYGPYEERTVHAVIVDALGPVAAARTIWSPEPGLRTKLEDDLGLLDDELRGFHQVRERYGSDGLSELATAAVERRARGTIVTGWILGEMRYQQMRLDPNAPSCAMIDLPFNRMIKIWGHKMHDACALAPIDYMGHVCQPTFFEPGPQEQIERSRLYQKFSTGWLQRTTRPVQSSEPVDITGETALTIS